MISVSGVSMRYGSKVLFDDVTTTFSAGRRYGLTGPNGAGKSTFMKLLTGELTPQQGTVVRPPKLGVLRQDQFAFDQFRVIDTVIMGNARLWAALEEREQLYAKADMTHDDGMRLGELEGIVGEEDGYTAESDAAILLQGLDIPDEFHERTMGEMQGGQKVRVLLAQALFRRPAGAAARRADEPPRPRLDSLAARVPRPLLGDADRHLARSPLPQLGLHAHRRHRLPDDHHVYRRLRRHGRRQDADSLADRGRQRAAREEDRAAERLHRTLWRGHAGEPGDVAAQGSRAARDDCPRAVEYPASVHQVPDEPAFGADRGRDQGREQGLRRRAGGIELQRDRESRREDRPRRPQRPGQDDAAAGAAGRLAEPARPPLAISTAARYGGDTKCRSDTSRRTRPA